MAKRFGWVTAALLALLAFQIAAFIKFNTATFDEAAFIGAGASYIKTGRLDIEHSFHPPLQKYLFGLAVNALHPSFPNDANWVERYSSMFGCFRFGHEFLYKNSVSAAKILMAARGPTMALSLLLGLFIALWARRLFGPEAGLLALAAYALEPNVIANSGLATMDVALACHMFAASFFLVRYLEENRVRDLVCSAVFAGLAAATKLPGLFFFAWAFGFCVFYRKKGIVAPAIIAVGIVAVLLLVYQVRFAPMLVDMVRLMFGVVFKKNAVQDYPNFLHGQLKVGGWWYFYPVVFFVKTSLPFVALWIISLMRLPRKEKNLLLMPVLSFVFLLTVADKQHGWRYLMPAVPFLCVMIGGLASTLPEKIRRTLIGSMVALMAVEAAYIFPNNLAYFSPLVGGPANGYKWLVDCNLDWGQDFDRIADYLKSQPPAELIVAVFGTGDRDAAFGPHQDLLGDSNNPDLYFKHVNSERPARELLIVSATLLQGFGLSDPSVFNWIRVQKPIAQIGYSTFVYDITYDALSEYNIGILYKRNGQEELAARQLQLANRIEQEAVE